MKAQNLRLLYCALMAISFASCAEVNLTKFKKQKIEASSVFETQGVEGGGSYTEGVEGSNSGKYQELVENSGRFQEQFFIPTLNSETSLPSGNMVPPSQANYTENIGPVQMPGSFTEQPNQQTPGSITEQPSRNPGMITEQPARNPGRINEQVSSPTGLSWMRSRVVPASNRVTPPGTTISPNILPGLLPSAKYIENTFPATGSSISRKVGLRMICSDSYSSGFMPEVHNLQQTDTVVLAIYDHSDRLTCLNQEQNFKEALFKNKQFDLNIPCQLPDGHYRVKFVDPRNLVNPGLGIAHLQILIKDGQIASPANPRLNVLYATNPKSSSLNNLNLGETYERCESYQSPLVVKVREDRGLRLSSIEDGVMFDIMGARGGYKKHKISWPIDDTIAFIALPDRNGQVRGIDQLFGNNTLGPDRRFAKDGYAALAKYDRNGDLFIDKADPIFKKLRLFFDRNRDGISQAGELVPLYKYDIQKIDLESIDWKYREVDPHGNQILFKSVAYTSNDAYLVFDIWFRVVP